MKQIGLLLFAGILLVLIAGGLARISQLLAAHVPWPLLSLVVGGGLGAGAALVWQQGWVKSWPAMVALTVLAATFLGVAEHYFAWQHLIANQEAEWLKNLRDQPQLAMFSSPFAPPTWSEFMSGGNDPWRTWAWWVFDASVKGLIAVVVLILRRGSPKQHVSPIETAA